MNWLANWPSRLGTFCPINVVGRCAPDAGCAFFIWRDMSIFGKMKGRIFTLVSNTWAFFKVAVRLPFGVFEAKG